MSFTMSSWFFPFFHNSHNHLKMPFPSSQNVIWIISPIHITFTVRFSTPFQKRNLSKVSSKSNLHSHNFHCWPFFPLFTGNNWRILKIFCTQEKFFCTVLDYALVNVTPVSRPQSAVNLSHSSHASHAFNMSDGFPFPRYYSPELPRIQTFVLVRLFVRSHHSVFCLLPTARFARALRSRAPLRTPVHPFAHSLTPKLVGKWMIRCWPSCHCWDIWLF